MMKLPERRWCSHARRAMCAEAPPPPGERPSLRPRRVAEDRRLPLIQLSGASRSEQKIILPSDILLQNNTADSTGG